MNNDYIRTDLAVDLLERNEAGTPEGMLVDEKEMSEFTVKTIDITTAAAAESAGKPMGRYVTLFCGNVGDADAETRSKLSSVLSDLLKKMINDFPECKDKPKVSALIAGLGNRYITADAIGPLAAKNINVTRHIGIYDEKLLQQLDCSEISAVSPGVVAQTGIETVELIRGAAKNVKPDVVIVIDALAAASCERLATTIQLSDTGICPGSGIGNKRKAINRNTIGFPVISVGIPIIVDSSTLVYDALNKAGITDLSDSLREVLENGKSFFVTPKDTDSIVNDVSEVIADGINMTFGADGLEL